MPILCCRLHTVHHYMYSYWNHAALTALYFTAWWNWGLSALAEFHPSHIHCLTVVSEQPAFPMSAWVQPKHWACVRSSVSAVHRVLDLNPPHPGLSVIHCSCTFCTKIENCYWESFCFLWWRSLLSQSSLWRMQQTIFWKLLTEPWISVQSIPPLWQTWFCVALFGLAVLLVALFHSTIDAKKDLPFLFSLINGSNCALELAIY